MEMKVVQLENLKAEQIWLYYMARVIIYQDVKKTRWVDEKLHPIKLYRDYNVSQVITAKERSKPPYKRKRIHKSKVKIPKFK